MTRLRSQNTTEGKAEKLKKVLSLTSLLKQDQHQTTTVFAPDSCLMRRCVTQATIRLLFFYLQPKACLWSFPIPSSSHLTYFASLLTYYFHLAPAAAPRLLQFPLFFSYSHPPLTAHDITVGSDAQLPFSFFFLIFIYFWLHQAFVATCKIFAVA